MGCRGCSRVAGPSSVRAGSAPGGSCTPKRRSCTRAESARTRRGGGRIRKRRPSGRRDAKGVLCLGGRREARALRGAGGFEVGDDAEDFSAGALERGAVLRDGRRELGGGPEGEDLRGGEGEGEVDSNVRLGVRLLEVLLLEARREREGFPPVPRAGGDELRDEGLRREVRVESRGAGRAAPGGGGVVLPGPGPPLLRDALPGDAAVVAGEAALRAVPPALLLLPRLDAFSAVGTAAAVAGGHLPGERLAALVARDGLRPEELLRRASTYSSRTSACRWIASARGIQSRSVGSTPPLSSRRSFLATRLQSAHEIPRTKFGGACFATRRS